jgi:hypothetical protein
VDDREEKQSEVEERDTSVLLHIEGILCIEEKEKDIHISLTEGDPLHPTQARLCVKPMTPCACPRSKNLS